MRAPSLIRIAPLRALTLLAACVCSSTVHAETPNAEMRTAARELAREGADLAQAGKCDEALDRFQRAFAIVPAPTIAVHEARCLAQLGRLLEAADRYELVQRSPLEPGAPAAFTEAVEEARTALIALRPRIPRLKVQVSGIVADEPTLKVLLNDRELPHALLGVDRPIDPGTYTISASAKGRRTAREILEIEEGANHVIDLELSPLTAKQPSAPKPAPAATTETDTSIDAETEPERARSSTGRTVGWAFVGIGTAGVASGVITALLAQDKERALEADCDGLRCPESARDDLDSMRLMRTLSFVGYGVGIAALATGGVLLLSSADSSSNSARTELGLGVSKVFVRGSF
jgi:hypothetical protein